MAQAFAELSVAQIQAGLTAKEFSAKEVAENSLARIVSADKAVHAFLETTEEAALAAAARVDAAIAAGDIAQAGPLAGVPVAFKDNMNLEGTHTTCSSRMLENYVSPYTATCVSKIIEAGGIPSTPGIWSVYPAALLAALLLRWLPVLQRLLWAPTRVAPSVSLAASAARLP